MALNILDGIISPLSNITEARFGIPWGVRVELETDGIVDFPLTFPGQFVKFEVTSDLPTPGTELYSIVFVDGVVGSEGYNFPPFSEFDEENFRMKGSYDAATKTYSFQEPGGTVRTAGDKLWLRVRVGGSFPSVSDIDVFNNVQHPFQFTLAGVTNGHQRTEHLFETPKKGLTIKMPFFKRTGPLQNETNTDLDGWTTTPTGGEPVLGRRVLDTLRASQPFEMLSEWGGGSLAGQTTTQSGAMDESDLTWGVDEDEWLIEHPQCLGVGGPFVDPGTQTGAITQLPSVPSDSGDGLRVTYPATPASQTLHQLQQVLTSPSTGSGTAACVALTTPPNGDILDTDAYKARSSVLTPPAFGGWSFDRWLEQ